MLEKNVKLQEAIDICTKMVEDRVTEYLALKEKIPSFGPRVDEELRKYHTALEYFVQGTVVWYYTSPREYTHLLRSIHFLCPLYRLL